MYLLDTCVISESRKIPAGRADANFRQWFSQHLTRDSFISVITVKELLYGVLLVERRDPRQGQQMRTWLDSVLAEYSDHTYAVDDAVARRAASLHVPDPAPEADVYIAATALVHGLCLVTRNVKDFSRFAGLSVVNPWD
jgi:predicted nucleic acid-binding protein